MADKPSIDRSLAEGLRRTVARSFEKEYTEFQNNLRESSSVGQEERARKKINKFVAQNVGFLCKFHRPPRPGVPGGLNVLHIRVYDAGQVFALLVPTDRRERYYIPEAPNIFLMIIFPHAFESLFQRLKTLQLDTVMEEIKPALCWLGKNFVSIASQTKGLLLTPSGVFPVERSEAFEGSEEILIDANYCWDARTWISDAALEDHTPAKRRIAQAVKDARANSEIFVPL